MQRRQSLINYPSWSFPTYFENFENFFNSEEEQSGLSVYEDKGHFCVEAALPGLTNKNIDVSIDQGTLIIQGSKQESKKSDENRYFCKSDNCFFYRVALPGQLNSKKAPTCTFKNGLLTLTFAKAPESQAKKIAVKNG